MDRRGYLLLGGVAVCAALTSGFRELDVDASAPAPTTEVAELLPIATLGEREKPYFDADPRTFSGDGGTTTTFSSDGGFTALVATHDGPGEFVVEVGPVESGESTVVLDAAGPGTSVTGLPMAADEYRVGVTADGPWELTLAQPDSPAADIRRPPARATGTGDAVVGPIDTNGDALVRGIHEGEGRFIVDLVPEASTGLFTPETLFDGIGAIDGESGTTVAGVSWVVVTATGSWTLAFDELPAE